MRNVDAVKKFQVEEETRLRKKLASLNRDNVQAYFNGIDGVLNELDDTKNDLEADEQLRLERLAGAQKLCVTIKKELNEIRKRVVGEYEAYKSSTLKILGIIEKESPELLKQICELSDAEERLKQLEFVKKFDDEYRNMKTAIDNKDYLVVLNSYKSLLVDDVLVPADCVEGFKKHTESLSDFLAKTLKTHLYELFNRIHFPFDNPIDYRAIKDQLETSVEILRVLREVYNQANQDDYELIQLVIKPFEERFSFHFIDDRQTNDPSRPEWFLSQVLAWIDSSSEYFESYIQRLFDEWNLNESADVYFAECLVKQVAVKIRLLLQSQSFVENRQHFSHLLDETISFSNTISEIFGKNTDIPEVISLFLEPNLLDEWIELEKEAISIAIDDILASSNAFENRFEMVNDIDALMVPNFADTFVILMQSMSERYLSFNDSNLRCRFLTHQLVIVDEFLQRIAQIFHRIDCPWDSPYPQLINSLWFIAIVLDEWSVKDDFIQLNAVGTDQPLSRGTFDEMAELYRHEWRKRARNWVTYFRESIDHKIRHYAGEKWFQMNHPKPLDLTVTLGSFADLIVQKIFWTNSNISEHSRLTIHRLLNEEVWTCLIDKVITETSFTSRGAAQMLFDVQNGLIPLLQAAFVPSPHLLKADSAFKHFEVAKSVKCREAVNWLKVLSLPSATAILLKSEIERIPESMLAEKLEPFKIDDIGRDKILSLFEQRCDMSQLL